MTDSGSGPSAPTNASPPLATPTVRAATGDDVDDVLELVTRAYRGEVSTKGWTTENDLLGGQRADIPMVTDAIADPRGVVLLAERDGALVGCIQVTRAGDSAHFGMFAVDPETQAGGVGSKLLNAAERIARDEWRCSTMDLEVIAQRSELIAFYERRGYALSGETSPFPYGDERFGTPRRDDLYFVVLRRGL